MKNISYILNAILFVLVGILFYLHFDSKTAAPALSGAKASTQAAAPVPAPDGKVQAQPQTQIVYINTDTLFEKYNYYKSLKKQLENQNKAAETALDSRAKSFESKMRAYQIKVGDAQQKMQSNQLNELEAIRLQKEFADTEKTLGQEEQEILKYREKLGKDLIDKEEKLQKQLKTRIDTYLKKTSEANGYAYVLAYSAASSVLYGGKTLDITNDVVAELNSQK